MYVYWEARSAMGVRAARRMPSPCMRRGATPATFDITDANKGSSEKGIPPSWGLTAKLPRLPLSPPRPRPPPAPVLLSSCRPDVPSADARGALAVPQPPAEQ